jgi:hypothetical protein
LTWLLAKLPGFIRGLRFPIPELLEKMLGRIKGLPIPILELLLKKPGFIVGPLLGVWLSAPIYELLM